MGRHRANCQCGKGKCPSLAAPFDAPFTSQSSPPDQHVHPGTEATIAPVIGLIPPPSPSSPFANIIVSDPTPLSLPPPASVSLSSMTGSRSATPPPGPPSPTMSNDSDEDWDPIESSLSTPPRRRNAQPPAVRSERDDLDELPPSIVSATTNLDANEKASSGATDVWYFMIPSATKELTDSQQDVPCPAAFKRPVSAFLGCYFCSVNGISHTWKNSDGVTSPVRRHFELLHEKKWKMICISFKLKNWERYAEEATPEGKAAKRAVQQEWSLEGFLDRLVKWMVVEDQPDRAIDSPELRDLLLFCGRELRDEDIPHRDRIGRLVMMAFKQSWNDLITELASSEGSVSLTADMWTSPAQDPFLAMTAHFTIRSRNFTELRTRLIAFRKIDGTHSGLNMARHVARVLHELKLTRKIGQITLDNASNNDTMMRYLEAELGYYDIEVELPEEKHRCRCFPHIINIAVHTALKSVTNLVEPEPLHSDVAIAVDSSNGSDEHDPIELEPERVSAYPSDWRRVLSRDVVAKVRKLVNACRKSPQRHESLRQYIRKGTDARQWNIKPLQLLRDVDTRWSSVYLMIERYLYLHPAIDSWLSRADQSDLHCHRLERNEIIVLEKIKVFLGHFHSFQQSLSAERTPTIHLVIPAFEALIADLRVAQGNEKLLDHAYAVALAKLGEYKKKCSANPVYMLSIDMSGTPLKLRTKPFYSPFSFNQTRIL